MNPLKICLYFVLLAALNACTPLVDWEDREAIGALITIEHDEFKKQTSYKGPRHRAESFDSFSFLRAYKADGNPSALYQIYVRSRYRGDWRFYDRAHDENGIKLNFVQIDRSIVSCSGTGGCSLAEDAAITVAKSYLQRHVASGIRFKISGKAGEEIFTIPGTYIEAFLEVVEG